MTCFCCQSSRLTITSLVTLRLDYISILGGLRLDYISILGGFTTCSTHGQLPDPTSPTNYSSSRICTTAARPFASHHRSNRLHNTRPKDANWKFPCDTCQRQ